MTDPTITIAGLRATIEREYYREQARTMAGEIVELQAERRGHAAELQSLTAERDALAAQLAEVRAELSSNATKRDGRISAICRALDIDDDRDVVDAIDEMRSRHANDLASERAHLAACRTRIAGLERAADERSAEVARLTARVAELEARPVLDASRLAWALIEVPRDGRTLADIAADTLDKLGPVTLPAQDRAEELTQAIHGTPREEVNPAMWRGMVERTRSALASLGAPPTSPPAARPVFAGVSEDELIRLFYVVGTDGIDHGEQCPPIDSSDRNGIRAVLARLEVSLVAPVDPEAVAIHVINDMATRRSDQASWTGCTIGYQSAVTAAMRATLIARGIPVTPEVGK